MMNKKTLHLFITCILLATAGYSQKAPKFYFLKDNGISVKSKNKADFFRVIKEPDSGSVFYDLLEFYPDDSKKMVGKVSKYDPNLVFEGKRISYYKNGNRSEIMTFEKGKPVGDRYEYYVNGKLKLRIAHLEDGKQPYWDYFDSTGVQLIKDGNGFYKTFENDLPVNEEGNYVNGFKDGVWKGIFNKRDASYVEVFDKGKFISGNAKLDDGFIHTYTKPEEKPDYPGGMKNFLKYVGNNYKYTYEAQKMGVSGRVTVTFVVEKDGSLADMKVLSDLGYGTGEAALKVLRGSPNWIPGRQHGVPVRVSYTLPIALSISIR